MPRALPAAAQEEAVYDLLASARHLFIGHIESAELHRDGIADTQRD